MLISDKLKINYAPSTAWEEIPLKDSKLLILLIGKVPYPAMDIEVLNAVREKEESKFSCRVSVGRSGLESFKSNKMEDAVWTTACEIVTAVKEFGNIELIVMEQVSIIPWLL